MTVSAPAETTEHQVAVPSDDATSLRRLQREMLARTSSADTILDLLGALLGLLDRHAKAVAMLYFQRDEQGELASGIQLRPAREDNRSERIAKQLLSACQTACRVGEIEVRHQASPARAILAIPIARRGSDPDALGLIFSTDQPASHLEMLSQLLASHIVLWHVMADGRSNEADARDAAAIVELLDKVIVAPDLREACYTLAGELKSFLHCRRVAVGLRSATKGRCRLVAVSGIGQFDNRSSTAQAIEAAMDEAVLRQEITVWPAATGQQRHAALAHRNLCSLEETKVIVSTPLRGDDENVVGVLVLFDPASSPLDRTDRFLRGAERPLATSLATAQRLEGGWFSRSTRAIGGFWSTWKGKIAVATVGLMLAAMLIPLPHHVKCDCQVEPVIRRFVAAPFEGTLEKALVKPGDVVHKGDVLARMDGREVRWKRASVAADQNQAIKRRDAAQASHNYSDQQIARLEIERLELELQLLDHRADNLEIKCPVDGIVASGDLERVEGAPLTIGQTLFEIAPLESMIVEVAVPDDEVALIASGQTIDVRLDAYPGHAWQLLATNIQPRSEIRDEKNVFITEAELDNTDGRLRPGMKGRASIETDHRPLGWILFHKPWEYVTKKLRW